MERYVRRVLSRTTGRPASREAAEEIVQDFLATCIEKQWLSKASPLRGRFRAYARTLLRRYTYGRLKYERARKRRPPGEGKRLPLLEDEAVDTLTPAEQAEFAEFDASWVKIAVDRALDRLREEHERYQVVILDLVATRGEGSEDLPQRVGVHRAQFPVLKHRARARFAKLFEEELAATVDNPDAFSEEWRALAPYMP